jgi:hypothetical protein
LVGWCTGYLKDATLDEDIDRIRKYGPQMEEAVGDLTERAKGTGCQLALIHFWAIALTLKPVSIYTLPLLIFRKTKKLWQWYCSPCTVNCGLASPQIGRKSYHFAF